MPLKRKWSMNPALKCCVGSQYFDFVSAGTIFWHLWKLTKSTSCVSVYLYFAIISKLNMTTQGTRQHLLGALHPCVRFLHRGDGTPPVTLAHPLTSNCHSLERKCNKKHRIPVHCRQMHQYHGYYKLFRIFLCRFDWFRQIKLLTSVKF